MPTGITGHEKGTGVQAGRIGQLGYLRIAGEDVK